MFQVMKRDFVFTIIIAFMYVAAGFTGVLPTLVVFSVMEFIIAYRKYPNF